MHNWGSLKNIGATLRVQITASIVFDILGIHLFLSKVKCHKELDDSMVWVYKSLYLSTSLTNSTELYYKIHS